jgi:hypothetical protein
MAAAVIAAINQNVARALSRISPNVIFCGRPVMVRRQDRNSGQSTPGAGNRDAFLGRIL